MDSRTLARTILFYTHAFSGGGAEIVFGRLAGAFAAAGDRVIFAADYQGAMPPRDGPTLRHVLLGPSHIEAIRRLADLLRDEKPDASFSALGAQNLKHLAAAIIAGRRGRCVLGYHGFAVAEPRPLARLSYWVSPLTTRLAAWTICVSDALLADIRTQWRAASTRTSRIYNPVKPAVAALTDNPPLVLACGRLVPGKRFVDLVEAFADVTPPTARLAILGEGPERGAIEAAVERCGLAGRTDLPGYVEDPSSWYARAACVVVASESESFGLTAAEALVHGVPVVSTACGGPEEILEQGRLGRIVPVGDRAALAQAIAATLAKPGDRAPRLARAEAFSLATVHAAYAELADTVSANAYGAR